MIFRKTLLILFSIIFCHLAAIAAHATEVYYLFDNSGSMYDGYPAPKSGPESYYYRRSEFQSFLREFVSKTSKSDDQVSIITFNRTTNRLVQSISQNSLKWEMLFAPKGRLDVTGATSPEDIKFTRMPDAVRELLSTTNAQRAIIWLLTDNIADKGNSQEALDTREFYKLLASEPRIQMVYAFPILKDPINRRSMLMVYGIVLGSQEPFSLAELKQWESGYLSTPDFINFCGVDPFKMKPLGRNTLELRLKDDLKLDAVDEDSPLTGSVDIAVSSKFNYYTISSAKVHLRATDLEPDRTSISRIAGNQFQFSPQQPYSLKNIKPQSETLLNITFTTPQVSVSPSRNNFATIFADIFDEEFPMRGSLQAHVENVQLKLELPPKMQNVFGANEIPEIFRPEKVDMEDLKIEINPRVRNSGGRLLLLLLIAALLIIGLIAFFTWFLMPQNYYLSFDDSFEFYKRYSLRRKAEARIKSDSGETLGMLRRDWGTDWRFVPDRHAFKRVSDVYSNVALARIDADESDIAYRLFIRTKRPVSKNINE
ncbi:MAG: hypothetical protein JNN15_14675 [Blastocatellia bacterium]|nr:hypothetical protein [Blastocatellia bacterium]